MRNSSLKKSRLAPLYFLHNNKHGHSVWLFQCDCGKQKEAVLSSVRSGAVKSCGCLHMERCRAGLNRLVHGDARKGRVARLHIIWRKMIRRCYAVNDTAYSDYGGRGIDICSDWLNDYVRFRDWCLISGYSESLTIDRIDNDKGYGPDNCKFSNRKEQARNRRSSKLLTFNGKTQCMAAWAEEIGISNGTLWAQLNTGWSLARALKGD